MKKINKTLYVKVDTTIFVSFALFIEMKVILLRFRGTCSEFR